MISLQLDIDIVIADEKCVTLGSNSPTGNRDSENLAVNTSDVSHNLITSLQRGLELQNLDESHCPHSQDKRALENIYTSSLQSCLHLATL